MKSWKHSVVALSAAMTLAVPAWGDPAGPGARLAQASKGAPSGALQVSIWYSLAPGEASVFQRLLSEYDQKNPYVEIEGKNFLSSATLYRELTSGTAHPTMALMETSWLPAVQARGQLMPLEQWMPKEQFLFNWSVKGNNYLPLWNAVQVGGVQMAMPFCYTTRALIYNPEVLQTAGVKFAPATWEQVAQAAQKISQSGAGIGFTLAANANPEHLCRNLQVMCWQTGGDLATSHGVSPSLDGANKALAYLHDLTVTKKAAMADPTSPDGVGMTIGTVEDYLALRARGVNVRTAAIPGVDKSKRTTEAQAWALGMFAVDPAQLYKVRDVAFYILDFQQQLKWAEETPYLAAHVKVFDNPFYRQARLADHNNLRVFVNVLGSARMVDTSGNARPTLERLGKLLPLVIKGEKSAQEVLK